MHIYWPWTLTHPARLSQIRKKNFESNREFWIGHCARKKRHSRTNLRRDARLKIIIENESLRRGAFFWNRRNSQAPAWAANRLAPVFFLVQSGCGVEIGQYDKYTLHHLAVDKNTINPLLSMVHRIMQCRINVTGRWFDIFIYGSETKLHNNAILQMVTYRQVVTSRSYLSTHDKTFFSTIKSTAQAS